MAKQSKARTRPRARRRPQTAARTATRAAARKRSRKAAPRKASRPAAKRPAAKRQAGKARGKASAPRSKRPAKLQAKTGPVKPRLERERRRLPEAERLDVTRDLGGDRMMAAARSGHKELRTEMERHTETSPALTAGDMDARWEDAYAVGDEAPGGDNPTPDQDRVDDIGKALGVTYQDDQELQGGDEIVERDRQRWELDPASSDDWPHKE